MAESDEELKRLLMKVKVESEKLAWISTFRKLRSWHPVLSLQGKSWGNSGNSERLYFFGLQNHCRWNCCHEIKRCLLLGRKFMTNLDSILKSRDITLVTKVHLVKTTGFSSGHVWMWELDHKESWALNNWCFWTVVLERTLETPLNCKDIQPVHPKRNQP